MTDTVGGYEAILQKLDDMVKSRFIELFYNHPEWPRSAISDIVQKSIQNAVIQFDADEKIRYVDISSIDAKTNRIASITEYLMKQAPSRARQCIQNGDILVSTVRPNLKNIAVCNDLSSDLVCSTGFCVLRVNSVKSEFLLGLVTSDAFTAEMIGKSRGASYPAITDDDVLKFSFNMPPMSIQTKFSKFIHEVDKSKAIVRQCIEKYNQLVKSRFIEMFEKSSTKYVYLNDICTNAKIGPFGSALHKTEMATEGPVFVLGTDNAVDNVFMVKEKRFINNIKYSELKNYSVNSGDIIITMMGTVGRSAVVPNGFGPAIISSHLSCITIDPKKAESSFIQESLYLSNEIQKQIENEKKGSIMNGLNLSIIKRLMVPLPSIIEQNKFIVFVKQVDKSKYAINGNDKNKVD